MTSVSCLNLLTPVSTGLVFMSTLIVSVERDIGSTEGEATVTSVDEEDIDIDCVETGSETETEVEP